MTPANLLQFELRAFLLGLLGVLLLKMLTGGISLDGLFQRKGDGEQGSPERIQLLIATLVVSSKYLGEVLHGTGNSMPDVSPQMLYLFGGSSGIYASVKAITTWKK